MLLGIIEAIWGGTPIPLKPNSTFDLGGLVSKPQVVGSRVDFSNSIEPSEIKLKVAFQKGDKPLSMFPPGVQRELQIHCDSGQIFVYENAVRSGKLPVTSGDNSEIEVTFAAGTPLEMSA